MLPTNKEVLWACIAKVQRNHVRVAKVTAKSLVRLLSSRKHDDYTVGKGGGALAITSSKQKRYNNLKETTLNTYFLYPGDRRLGRIWRFQESR